jgi:RES domain-containing protein
MKIYRISLSKWANSLQGSGFAARWNSKNIFVLYFAESRSLACLENVVHMSAIHIQGLLYSLIVYDVPDNYEEITTDMLPNGWNGNNEDAYRLCRPLGDEWARQNKSLILKVPSAISSGEYNFILNPNHPEVNKINLVTIEPYIFDPRIKI